ncbi:16337_t:CDS:2 [Dentiscutata erythropus]|uniref:16337_t:CDS:1 n=1 Tax=Dentiscutata erythropus TaxID=1348616 RepID=A0A9N9HRT6_9GLOM|nr:16337_t:CDS:2 [Dentiscutata erythropus]
MPPKSHPSYDEQYPLPPDFFRLITKLKKSCVGKIISITFNENGSVLVVRNVESLVRNGRPSRSRFGSYNIESKYDEYEIENFDFFNMVPSNEFFDDLQLETLKEKLQKAETALEGKEKQIEINRLKGKGTTNSLSKDLLKKIFEEIEADKIDETEADKDEQIWRKINSKLETIFGYQQTLNNPTDETQKKKYLSWIFALQFWEKSNKFPITHWVERAKTTFDNFSNEVISDSTVSVSKKKSLSKKRALSDENLSNKKFKYDKDLDSVAKILRSQMSKNKENYEETNQAIISMEIDCVEIEFGDSKESIESGLAQYFKRTSCIDKMECNLDYLKWNHFLNLIPAYDALIKFVDNDPPTGQKTRSIRDKKDNFIPLGRAACDKSKRRWISYQISTLLLINTRDERKLWVAIKFVKKLLTKGLFRLDLLIKNKIRPDFFKKMTKED